MPVATAHLRNKNTFRHVNQISKPPNITKTAIGRYRLHTTSRARAELHARHLLPWNRPAISTANMASRAASGFPGRAGQVQPPQRRNLPTGSNTVSAGAQLHIGPLSRAIVAGPPHLHFPPNHALDEAVGPRLARCCSGKRGLLPAVPSTSAPRMTMLQCLRIPLQLAPGSCHPHGDSRAACATFGVLSTQALPREHAVARVCREVGAKVARHVHLADMNLDVPITDERRIEVVANGLPLSQSMPLWFLHSHVKARHSHPTADVQHGGASQAAPHISRARPRPSRPSILRAQTAISEGCSPVESAASMLILCACEQNHVLCILCCCLAQGNPFAIPCFRQA